jgi:hypothetical protein
MCDEPDAKVDEPDETRHGPEETNDLSNQTRDGPDRRRDEPNPTPTPTLRGSLNPWRLGVLAILPAV